MLSNVSRAPSTRNLLLRSASVIALGAVLAPAHAQTAATAYQGPTADANWSDGANWTNGAPNSGSATTVNNGQTVNTDGSNSTGTLTVGPVAGSGVNVATGTILSVSGPTITNAGQIALNGALQLRGDTTLSGGGTLTITGPINPGNTGQIGTDGQGRVLNNQSTIQGSGLIGSNVGALYQNLNLTNSGVINGNSTANALELGGTGGYTINTGTLEATGGGGLILATQSAINNGGGLILATGAGSTVTVSTTIQGGTLATSNGGVMQTVGTAGLDGASSGAITLSDGSTYTANSGLTSVAGTLNLGTTAGSTLALGGQLRLTGDTTLAGPGSVTLSGNGQIGTDGQNRVLNNQGTIQGSGVIGSNVGALYQNLNLTNTGTINANASGQTLSIQGTGGSIVNARVFEATNGGTLNLQTTAAISNQAGTIAAIGGGSTVTVSTTIGGGTLATSGGGVMQTVGTAGLDGASSGAITLSDGSTYTANSGLTSLAGTLNLGTTAGSTVALGGQLRLTGDTTLAGPGSVTLSGNGQIGTDGQNRVLNNQGTIQGSGLVGSNVGSLYSNGSVNNQGLILAMGGTLTVAETGGVTNTGTLQAGAGSTLNVTSPLTNFNAGSNTLTGGTYRADAAGTVNLNTGAITTNAATVVLNGTGSAVNTQAGAIETTLTTNAQGGSLQILNNRNYATANALTNSGAIQLGGGTLAPSSLTNTATGTLTGFGSVAPTGGTALANAGTVTAAGGTLALATGITGTGTLQSNAGSTASLAAGPATNSVGTLALNGGSLALGSSAVTVSSDYTNTAFGTGNSFNKRANVTGTGAINASGNVAQTISGAGVANGSSANPTLNLGDFHTTDAAHSTGGASTTFQVNNTGTTGPALRGAIQTTGITDTRLTGSGVTAGNFGPVAPGGSTSYTVNVAGSSAGTLSGQSIHVANNFSNVAEQTVAITGTGYNYAQATNSTGSTVSLGNFHVGTAQSTSLSIGNTAPTGAYTEKLDGSAGAATGNATAAGSFTGLAAGSSSNAISVGLNTATAGAKSGTVTLNFTSNAAGVDSLGNSALPSQTVTVTGAAYNLASSSTIAPVNFGVLHTGTGTQTRTLGVTNTAAAGAYSEGLDSSFGAYTNNGGTLGVTAAGSFANLAAGATNNSSLTLSVSTAQAGTVNGTIQVHQASNGTIDGLGNTALPDQNPAVTGTVQATVTNLAQAQINTAQPVSFGNVRIGTTQQQALSITNAAPAGPYSESLVASVAGTSGGVTASGGFGPPSSVPSLAAQATDTTHVVVGINTGTAGAKSGNATLNFQSDGTAYQGGTLTNLGNTDVAVTGNVFRLASPTVNTPSVTLAARVGGTASGAISVTNTSPDSFTEGLKAGTATAPANFTSTGAISNLSAGSTDGTTLRVGLNTGTAGTFTGTQTLNFASTGAGTTGAADATLASGSVSLTGKVYAAATASVSPTAVNFGTVHVGDTATRALTVGNTATGALTDVLTGGFGTVSGGFTGTGTLGTGVAAGSTSNALTVGLNTSASGSYAGNAAFAFSSHDADLADIAAAAGPVSLSGTVDNYALSGFGFTNGAGTFGGSANSYTLDFGTVTQGSSALVDMLYAGNFAGGLADLLSGSFTSMGSSDFSLTGFNPFSGLGAGQDTSPLSVSFGTGSLGTFVDTITLSGIGSNSSGYSGAVANTTLTLRGTVVASNGGGGGGGTTPVPEPGTLAVLGSALAALFAFRRQSPRNA